MSTTAKNPLPELWTHGAVETPHRAGRIQQQTLFQGRYWWDAQGQRVRLTEMDSDFLANVICLLERSATALWLFGIDPFSWTPKRCFAAKLYRTGGVPL